MQTTTELYQTEAQASTKYEGDLTKFEPNKQEVLNFFYKLTKTQTIDYIPSICFVPIIPKCLTSHTKGELEQGEPLRQAPSGYTLVSGNVCRAHHLRLADSSTWETLTSWTRQGWGVGFAVNEIKVGEKRLKENVTKVRTIVLDYDAKTDQTKPTLPLTPSITIETSPGKTHEYFLLEELGTLTTTEYSDIERHLAKHYANDEAVIAPNQILRVPGFLHTKGLETSTFYWVTTKDLNDNRYSADKLKQTFPPILETDWKKVKDKQFKQACSENEPLLTELNTTTSLTKEQESLALKLITILTTEGQRRAIRRDQAGKLAGRYIQQGKFTYMQAFNIVKKVSDDIRDKKRYSETPPDQLAILINAINEGKKMEEEKSTTLFNGGQANGVKLELAYSGKIKATASNLKNMMDDSAYCGYEFAYDTFIECRQYRPTGTENWLELPGDFSITLAREFIDKGYEYLEDKAIEKHIIALCSLNIYDSYKNYILSHKWDGVNRLETFFTRYYGCPDTPYHRAVANYMFTALIDRGLNPGCQVDMAVVLVSYEEGTRKTSMLRALSAGSDRICKIDVQDLRNKDTLQRMAGRCIYNLPELVGLGKLDYNKLKDFITETADKYRPPFERGVITHQRTGIFIGDTNETQFLSESGKDKNRRFLPVTIPSRETEEKTNAIKLLNDDCYQLWGEALELFKAKGQLYEEAETLAKEEHSKYTEEDVFLEPYIEQFLKEKKDKMFQTHEVIEYLIEEGKEPKGSKYAITRDITKVLRKFSCIEKQVRPDNKRYWSCTHTFPETETTNVVPQNKFAPKLSAMH